MSSQQKKFLALLAVLGIAFTLVLLAGGRSRGDRSAGPPSWVKWLEGKLVDSSALGIKETEGECKVGDAFMVDQEETCEITIPARGVAVRSALLRLDEGQKVSLVLTQSATVPQRQTLLVDGAVELKVLEQDGEEGADAKLELTCVRGNEQERCVLRLEKKS